MAAGAVVFKDFLKGLEATNVDSRSVVSNLGLPPAPIPAHPSHSTGVVCRELCEILCILLLGSKTKMLRIDAILRAGMTVI